MKQLATILLLTTGIAIAQTLPAVTVCGGETSYGFEVRLAKLRAAKIFAAAGVRIKWRSLAKCPANTIQVTFLERSRPTDNPGALAYAQPYEGTRIGVYYDRVKAARNGDHTDLLAHVLVHEITHVLQGTARHSETGIMKATYSEGDLYDMQHRPMTFESLDIRLIHSGLQHRQSQAAALMASSSQKR